MTPRSGRRRGLLRTGAIALGVILECVWRQLGRISRTPNCTNPKNNEQRYGQLGQRPIIRDEQVDGPVW